MGFKYFGMELNCLDSITYQHIGTISVNWIGLHSSVVSCLYLGYFLLITEKTLTSALYNSFHFYFLLLCKCYIRCKSSLKDYFKVGLPTKFSLKNIQSSINK